MNTIYRYVLNAKYHPNRGTYLQRLTGKELVEQAIVIDQVGSSFQTRFKDIFKQYAFGPVSNVFIDTWTKRPLMFWRVQLDFVVWCSTSGCGISMQHLNAADPMVRSVYRFHVMYQIRRMLYDLEVRLPGESGFNSLNNPFNRNKFFSILSAYGIADHSGRLWENQYIFSTHQGGGMRYIDKDSWSRWIMSKSNGLTRVGMSKLSESARAYTYLLLSSQANARGNIIGNDAKAVDAQNIYMSSFAELVIKPVDISAEIKRFQDVLRYARSKVDFSIAEETYMIPSDMNLHMGRIANFNNKILISKKGFQLGVNQHVNIQPQHKEPIHHNLKTTPKLDVAATPHSLSHKEGQVVKKHHSSVGEVRSPTKKLSYNEAHKEEKEALVIALTSLLLLGFWFFK